MLPAGEVAAAMLVNVEDLLAIAEKTGIRIWQQLEHDKLLNEIYVYDINYILRVISYGIATQSSDFIHSNNMGIMKLMHEEIGFPTGLISSALLDVKKAVLEDVNNASVVPKTAECFDVVIDFMS